MRFGLLFGFLEALFGIFWSQKLLKIKWFLRFLKWVFEALNVSFGLSLICCSAEVVRNRGPKRVPKLYLEVIKYVSKELYKTS